MSYISIVNVTIYKFPYDLWRLASCLYDMWMLMASVTLLHWILSCINSVFENMCNLCWICLRRAQIPIRLKRFKLKLLLCKLSSICPTLDQGAWFCLLFKNMQISCSKEKSKEQTKVDKNGPRLELNPGLQHEKRLTNWLCH